MVVICGPVSAKPARSWCPILSGVHPAFKVLTVYMTYASYQSLQICLH